MKRKNRAFKIIRKPSGEWKMVIDNPGWNRRLVFSTSTINNSKHDFRIPIPIVKSTPMSIVKATPMSLAIPLPQLIIGQDPLKETRAVHKDIQDATVYTLPEYIEKFRGDISYLLGNIFPTVGIGGIIADNDVGKSTLVRQIGLAISYGEKQVIGFDLNAKHNRVLYLPVEDTRGDVVECIQDQLKGFNKNEITDNFRILDKKPYIENIEAALNDMRVDLVIIDTFIHLNDKSMHLPDAVSKTFERLRALAEKYKCFILIIHHTNKSKNRYIPNKDNSAGTKAITNNLRIQIELIPDPAEPDVIHFCIVKGNKIPRKEKTMSYKLRQGDHRLFYYTGERVPFNEIDQRKQKTSVENKTKSEVPKKGRGKLSQEATRDIYERLKSGEKQVDLAKEYGVTQGAISQLWTKHNRAA